MFEIIEHLCALEVARVEIMKAKPVPALVQMLLDGDSGPAAEAFVALRITSKGECDVIYCKHRHYHSFFYFLDLGEQFHLAMHELIELLPGEDGTAAATALALLANKGLADCIMSAGLYSCGTCIRT